MGKKIPSLIDPKNDRISFYPIKYPKIYNMLLNAKASYWTEKEIDAEKDITDYNQLSKEERQYLRYILVFFATADIVVNDLLIINFLNLFQVPELKSLIIYNMMIESVHNETYNKLIHIYCGSDQNEKDKIFSDVKDVKVIDNKVKWMKKWMGSTDKDISALDLALSFLASMCMEGIFFSSSFLAIYWLCSGGKNTWKKGQLPALGFSNELIARDEGTHAKLWIELINITLKDDMTSEEKELFYKKGKLLVLESIDIEKQFVEECLKVEFLGMKKSIAGTYIEYIADNLLENIDGFKRIFYVENPFPIMDLLNLKKQTNFFEKKSAEYQKGIIHKDTFSLKEDF